MRSAAAAAPSVARSRAPIAAGPSPAEQRRDGRPQLLHVGELVDGAAGPDALHDLADHGLVELRVLRDDEQGQVVREREHRGAMAAVPDDQRDLGHQLGVGHEAPGRRRWRARGGARRRRSRRWWR